MHSNKRLQTRLFKIERRAKKSPAEAGLETGMKVSGRRAFLPSYQLANVKSVPTRRSLDRCDGARRSRLPLDVGLARRAIVASGRLAIGKDKPRRSEAQDLRVGGGHPPWCLTGTGSCGARIKRLLAPQFGDAIELTSEMQAGERGTTKCRPLTSVSVTKSSHQRRLPSCVIAIAPGSLKHACGGRACMQST